MLIAVSNIGDVDGLETVQVYIRDEKSRLPRPEKELVAFEKLHLQAGETKHLRINIDKHAVGYYDTLLKAWVAEEGRFDVLIGASSVDIRLVPLFIVSLLFCDDTDWWLSSVGSKYPSS